MFRFKDLFRNRLRGRTAALFLLSPLALPAQQLPTIGVEVAAHDHAPVTVLGEVTVQGASSPTLTVPTLAGAQERADLVAGGAAVIDADSYRNGRASSVQDALGFAPGVFVQPRFGAEESRLSVRGSGIQRTFHGRGLSLLQDGAAVNLADGSFDFQAVEPLSADYIEVYRGANALEYGSTTLGGAINFISPTGYSAPKASARLEIGSFEYRRAQAALAGHTGNVDGYVSLSAVHSDGYRDHAQQDNYRLFSNLGIRLAADLETRLYFSFVDTESELPGSLTKAEAGATPQKANPPNVSNDQKRDFRLIRFANKTVWTIDAQQRIEASASYADKRLFHPIFQVIDQDNNDLGLGLRYENSRDLFGHHNRFVVGSRYLYGETREFDFVNAGGREGAQTDGSDQTASSAALYVENQFSLLPKLVLSLGAQGARDLRDRGDAFIPVGGTSNSFRKRYGAFSPKAGVRYDIDDGSQVFANVSRSFEPPSFAELTGGQITTVNSAQRGTTVEIGSRVERQWLALDLALYRAWLRDELLGLNDGNGQPLGTVNAPKTIHQGIELAAAIQLPYQLTLRQAYLLNDFKFDNDATYGNNRLAGLPTQSYRSDLSWKGQHFSAGPNVEWIPQGTWIDHANTFSSDGYVLIGFKVGGAITSSETGRWSWYVDGRNLTGEKHVTTTGVIANANGNDQRQFLPGDGRAVYAGISWAVGP